MRTLQIRLPDPLLKQVDDIIQKGFYSSRSDFLKEATRKYILEFKFAGGLPYIVGPYSKDEIKVLQEDPRENLFLSLSEINELKIIIKDFEGK